MLFLFSPCAVAEFWSEMMSFGAPSGMRGMCRVTDLSWLLAFCFSTLLAVCVPVAGVQAAGTAGWETVQKLPYAAQNLKYL